MRPPTLATSIVSSSSTIADSAQPHRRLIFSASGIGVRSPTAMSLVKWSPPTATTPVCHRLPRSKIAKSVVPPPMSTSATPSSFSSWVSTDSARRQLLEHGVERPRRPARFTQATMFCVDEALPVTTWTLTSSRAPVMPTGAPMPSCSSTTKSCGSTCRISRPLGSATAFAASIARRTSSRVISRFLPATATTPRLLKALTCGPGQPEVDRVDLDAGRQLGFVDRLLDRFDRRLEVHDDAAPDAARLGEADPDDVEPAVVGHLADDGGHLRRADVEADQVSFLSCHIAPPFCSGSVPCG